MRRCWTAMVWMAAVVAGACTGDPAAAPVVSTATTNPPVTTTALPAPTTAGSGAVVSLRVELRTADTATADFDAVVRATLRDVRGWQQAGFEFRFDDSAPYRVVLAEGDEVDALCFPYDTGGRYSCQNGSVVAFNADRWRSATPEWTGDLGTYRQMLVNHEIGHLLGRHHPPPPQCPEPGRVALVMSQQSTELGGCLPNPWPLAEEIAAARLHDEPLAPPYDG